jgi:kynureninase
MEALREKSVVLTSTLESALVELGRTYGTDWQIITPTDPDQRGCQLSLFIPQNGKALFDHLKKHNVIADWREPDVIRLAPVPLYNSFEDIYHIAHHIAEFYERPS